MGIIGDAWSADPDLGNRDPNNLNDHLQVRPGLILGLDLFKPLEAHKQKGALLQKWTGVDKA